MAIIPSGSRKIMKAQVYQNESLDEDLLFPYESSDLTASDVETLYPESIEDRNQKEEKSSDDEFVPLSDKNMEQKSDSEDLQEYIFNKLEDLGYPPRRLHQFENEFIDETLYPGGEREVSVTLPDRYYATRKRLKDTDISAIVKEIQSKFGLSFVEAKRKDKQIIMEFTSESVKSDKSEEEGDVDTGDVLDEVYGKSQGKSKSKNKSAQTLSEMMDKEKIRLALNILNKEMEKKNAS